MLYRSINEALWAWMSMSTQADIELGALLGRLKAAVPSASAPRPFFADTRAYWGDLVALRATHEEAVAELRATHAEAVAELRALLAAAEALTKSARMERDAARRQRDKALEGRDAALAQLARLSPAEADAIAEKQRMTEAHERGQNGKYTGTGRRYVSDNSGGLRPDTREW